MVFQSEVNKLATIVKVIIMSLGKSLLKSNALECKWEAKVPKPRPNAGEMNAQKTKEFIGNMEQDVVASCIEDMAFVTKQKLIWLK